MSNKGVYQAKLNQINSSGNKKNVNDVCESKSGRNADKHTNTLKVGGKMSPTEDPLPMPNDLFEIEITDDHETPNTTIITEEKGVKNPSRMVVGKLDGQEVTLGRYPTPDQMRYSDLDESLLSNHC